MGRESGIVAALVRHGAFARPPGVPSAHLPHPLTGEGRTQATRAATVLLAHAAEHGLTLDPRIDTSPLRRAWETAAIVARELEERTGLPFSVGEHPQLAERSLGAAANLSEDQIEIAVASDPRYRPLPPAWKRTPAHRLPFPGAETLIEAGERAAGHILRRTAEAAPRTVVVFVGHGGAFRHAAVALGVLDLERAAELSMNHAEPVLLVRRGDAWAHFAGAWRVREPAPVSDVVAS